jgi:chromosome segregation ATPase
MFDEEPVEDFNEEPIEDIGEDGGSSRNQEKRHGEPEQRKNEWENNRPRAGEESKFPEENPFKQNEIPAEDDGETPEFKQKEAAYLKTLREADRKRYFQLKEQNRKLKQELLMVAKATDEAIAKEKEKRQARNTKTEDSEEVKQKMQEIKEQQAEIDALKNQITLKKRQLEHSYQLNNVIAKEDELNYLKKQFAELASEKESLLRIQKEQKKALSELYDPTQEEEEKKTLAEQLKKAKQEYKDINEEYMRYDRAVKKNHDKLIGLKQEVTELKQKIHEFKSNKAKTASKPKVFVSFEHSNDKGAGLSKRIGHRARREST